MKNRIFLISAFFCAASCSRAETIYSYVIDQELSKIVRSSGFSPPAEDIFTINGIFDLVVDATFDKYIFHTARLVPRNIVLDPLLDPQFFFPQFILKYEETDAVTATIAASNYPCNSFDWSRDRGGTCNAFSPHGSFGGLSGVIVGDSLQLEGDQPYSSFRSYEYTIHATLANSVPEPMTAAMASILIATLVAFHRRIE